MLVAIDGSESSMHALKESFKLARNEKSWITVVSVVPEYRGDLDLVAVGNIMSSMKKPCEDALQKAYELAKAEGILIKTVCEEGEPYERIIDIANAENCELIVMGRRGLSRLERVLMGSVTARVIGHSPIDILIVPLDAEIGWQRILVATDGSIYSKAAADRALDFAFQYGGQLIVVSVVDVPIEFYGEAPGAVEDLIKRAKEYTEDVKRRAESAGIKAAVFVREGETYKTILDIAKEQNADTIVMGSHGRTGLKRLLMGSVTEKVIGYASCPVLVVKG
ncbi:universal stress protein [Dissulfurispira thermophila]|uniref:Universal stress protein n=2 Tax=root TaxID=1 RepID=A0A7G1GYZ3_9BACT|nr:universal stress protein [Dissulfurispira thermophila]BCB95700.1 universal stress protein [Dissulfurispira thermophila]